MFYCLHYTTPDVRFSGHLAKNKDFGKIDCSLSLYHKYPPLSRKAKKRTFATVDKSAVVDFVLLMMHRLRRYDVFRFAQNDVAPVGRNDAMFAPKCGEATHH